MTQQPTKAYASMHQQPLTFSKHMGNEQLALWLRNHPGLSGVDYEEDISKLIGIRTLPNTVIIIIVVKFLYLFRCQN